MEESDECTHSVSLSASHCYREENSFCRQKATTGTKGDPRMHQAVAARLANSEISLYNALKIGGFVFNRDDATGATQKSIEPSFTIN
jgi:hypothetical protein